MVGLPSMPEDDDARSRREVGADLLRDRRREPPAMRVERACRTARAPPRSGGARRTRARGRASAGSCSGARAGGGSAPASTGVGVGGRGGFLGGRRRGWRSSCRGGVCAERGATTGADTGPRSSAPASALVLALSRECAVKIADRLLLLTAATRLGGGAGAAERTVAPPQPCPPARGQPPLRGAPAGPAGGMAPGGRAGAEAVAR